MIWPPSRVVTAQKLGSQGEKFIGSLEVGQVPGTDLSAHRAGNARGQLGCLRNDLIVSTFDNKRGTCNASGLFAYIDSQIQFDLTCNPLPIGERHVPFDHVFDRRSAHARNKRRRESGEQEQPQKCVAVGPEQVKPELELKLEPRLCAPRKSGNHNERSDQICRTGCKLNCNRRSEGMADQIEPVCTGRAGHSPYLASKFLQAKRTSVIRRVSRARVVQTDHGAIFAELPDYRAPMRIERSGTVYEHNSWTAPVQSVCDTRIIDIYHACCCHKFTLSVFK